MEEAGDTFPTQLPSCHPTPLTMPTFSDVESLPRAILALASAAIHGEFVGMEPPPVDVKVEVVDVLAERLAEVVVAVDDIRVCGRHGAKTIAW
jgi:hypothetical protein